MKSRWSGILTALSLGALMVGTTVLSGCVVKGSAGVTASGGVTVVDNAPPPPRYESPAPRSGRAWLRGHWEYRNNQWNWRRGRWVRVRRGYGWEPGHWESRSGRYHFVRGRWVRGRARVVHRRSAPPPPVNRSRDYRKQPADPAPPPPADPAPPPPAVVGPVDAPPAPRYKTVKPRRGYVWIRGHYEWKSSGGYQWVTGRWARARAGKSWTAGRWERRGRVYFWVKGEWR